jgi:hypothetical protein
MLLMICRYFENLYKKGRTSFGCIQNYVAACTVKPHEIPKVKKALVKSVQCIAVCLAVVVCGVFIKSVIICVDIFETMTHEEFQLYVAQ